jgi:hypothetical protein
VSQKVLKVKFFSLLPYQKGKSAMSMIFNEACEVFFEFIAVDFDEVVDAY